MEELILLWKQCEIDTAEERKNSFFTSKLMFSDFIKWLDKRKEKNKIHQGVTKIICRMENMEG